MTEVEKTIHDEIEEEDTMANYEKIDAVAAAL